MTPEHLHLAINHIPFLGSAFALLPILVGLLRHHTPTLLTGLALAALAGWTTPLVIESGEQAYERYEHSAVTAYLDSEAEEYLHIHEERAEFWAKILYASAVAATLAFLFVLKDFIFARPLAIASASLCFLGLLAGIWIALSGGKIRRPDFRGSTLTPTLSEQHSDHDD